MKNFIFSGARLSASLTRSSVSGCFEPAITRKVLCFSGGFFL